MQGDGANVLLAQNIQAGFGTTVEYTHATSAPTERIRPGGHRAGRPGAGPQQAGSALICSSVKGLPMCRPSDPGNCLAFLLFDTRRPTRLTCVAPSEGRTTVRHHAVAADKPCIALFVLF